jgi:hypothetical protein
MVLVALFVLLLGLLFAYHLFGWAGGQTSGMAQVGLLLRRASGGPPGLPRALARVLITGLLGVLSVMGTLIVTAGLANAPVGLIVGPVVGAIVLFLPVMAYASMGRRPDRQTWVDRLLRLRVVRIEPTISRPVRLLRRFERATYGRQRRARTPR